MEAGSDKMDMRRVDLISTDELIDGELRLLWVDGVEPIVIVRERGRFFALQGVCSHEYFELDLGSVVNGRLQCALHLSEFDLESGEPLNAPADAPLAVYPVTVEGERVLVDMPDELRRRS